MGSIVDSLGGSFEMMCSVLVLLAHLPCFLFYLLSVLRLLIISLFTQLASIDTAYSRPRLASGDAKIMHFLFTLEEGEEVHHEPGAGQALGQPLLTLMAAWAPTHLMESNCLPPDCTIWWEGVSC